MSSDSYFSNQYLKALDGLEGTELWSFSFEGSAPGINSVSGPSTGNGLVYIHVGSQEDTALQAFDLQDGSQTFMGGHGGQWPKYLQPTIVGNAAFINGGTYGGMYGMDALIGSPLWFSSAVPWDDNWEPALANGALFVVTDKGISAFSPATGTNIFDIQTSLSPQTLVVGSRHNILARSAQIESFDAITGKSNWATRLVGQNFTQVAAGNGQVYGISNGTLYVFSEVSGRLLWQLTPATENLVSNIAVTATHVFVASGATTYAVNLQSHGFEWSFAASGKLSIGSDSTLMIVSGSQLRVFNL